MKVIRRSLSHKYKRSNCGDGKYTVSKTSSLIGITAEVQSMKSSFETSRTILIPFPEYGKCQID